MEIQKTPIEPGSMSKLAMPSDGLPKIAVLGYCRFFQSIQKAADEYHLNNCMPMPLSIDATGSDKDIARRMIVTRATVDDADAVYICNEYDYVDDLTREAIDYATSVRRIPVYYSNSSRTGGSYVGQTPHETIEDIWNKLHRNPFPIITLCGSSKFKAELEEAYRGLGWAGAIVFNLVGYMHSGDDRISTEPGLKARLDRIHMEKIRMSDAIYVVNKDGYLGKSTKREIDYAVSLGKWVYDWTRTTPADAVYELGTMKTMGTLHPFRVGSRPSSVFGTERSEDNG